MWVVNSDAEVRQLVENALLQYRQYLRMCLIFTEDLETLPADPPPQVLLINATGPAQSSLAPFASLRQRWPDAKVIFLSPLDDIHLWAEAIRMGAYDFLPKPIDPDQLKWVLIGAFPSAQNAPRKLWLLQPAKAPGNGG
jgi:DNA-binding NtrC family response regulator